MFSLIITIISIALVAALAVATIYYGGETFQQATTKALAATLTNQGSQLAAAGAVSVSQGTGWPSTAPTFGQPYLAAMPVPPKAAYADPAATPVSADWEYYMPGSNHFMLRNKISKAVCLAVNKQHGFIGIPAAWDGTSLVQCFGTGNGTTPAQYTFLFDPPGTTDSQKAAASLQSVQEAIAGGATSATPGYPRLCPDNSTIGTGICPGAPASSGGSGGGGGGGGSGGLVGDGMGDGASTFWIVSVNQVAGGMGGRAYYGGISDEGTSPTCPQDAINAGLLAASGPAGDFRLTRTAERGASAYVGDSAGASQTYCIPVATSEYVAFDGSTFPEPSDVSLTGPAWTDNEYYMGTPDFSGNANIYRINGKGKTYYIGGIRYRWGVDGPGWNHNGQQNGVVIGVSNVSPSAIAITSIDGTNAIVNLDSSLAHPLN